MVIHWQLTPAARRPALPPVTHPPVALRRLRLRRSQPTSLLALPTTRIITGGDGGGSAVLWWAYCGFFHGSMSADNGQGLSSGDLVGLGRGGSGFPLFGLYRG